MATRIFRGQIEDGRFCLVDRAEFAKLKESLEGKPIEITLKRLRPARSGNQNAYYWGVVMALFADHCGYEPQEMHEALKLRFLVVDPDAPLLVARSTTQLDTRQFTEYIEHVRQLAAEMGLYIPDPNEAE